MKSWQKMILIICCLLAMGISFMYHLRFNYNSLDEIKAPVHVNIEIDKDYMPFVSIMADLQSGDRLFPLSRTENNNGIQNTILYTEIKVENNVIPFIRRLFLNIPREEAQKTLKAIDNIGIFIGNKNFYFSHSDVANLQVMEKDDYIRYELQGLEYEKSIIATLLKMPQWINWYGDFNFAVKAIFAFITQPKNFPITWCFLICFLVLCWSNIQNIYSAMRKNKLPLLELLFLSFIVLVGFILRFNGYVRYSSWIDELYSACLASNPALPFMSTFGDPGNPPLYFILLCLWFMLFGWTEQSGRLFSVLIGSTAIISLYVMAKRFADKKTAFLAAAYMAVSAYFIGFSQEMRAYILEVFLVSIVAFRFLILLQERKLNLKNLIWYIIPSILLVNTHYYGSFFVFATFLFYVVYSIHTNTFTWKKTVVFFTVNLVIAFSLLPWLIHTALRSALLNSGFNTWIPKPELTMVCIAALIPILGILYIYLRRTIFQKKLSDSHNCFLDYSIFVTSVVYIIAFVISLHRPILITKYLIILYPFLIVVFSSFITNILTSRSKFIFSLCFFAMFYWIVSGYEGGRGGGADVYHETMVYISKDAEAHSQNTSMEVLQKIGGAHFYGYKELPLYVPRDNHDILYFNPLHESEEGMYLETDALGISRDRILRIRVNNARSVFKIYAGTLP